MKKDYGHNFKINDVVWLKHVKEFASIKTEGGVAMANDTSHMGIRKATKSEARKFRKEHYNGKKAF